MKYHLYMRKGLFNQSFLHIHAFTEGKNFLKKHSLPSQAGKKKNVCLVMLCARHCTCSYKQSHEVGFIFISQRVTRAPRSKVTCQGALKQ